MKTKMNWDGIDCDAIYCNTLEEGKQALVTYPNFIKKLDLIDGTFIYLFKSNATS